MVKVPLSQLITLSGVREKLPFKEWPGILEYEPLLFWILLESSNPESEFKPYLDSYPTDFSTHPFFWGDDVWPYCQGTGLHEITLMYRNAVKQSFDRLSETIAEKYPNLFPPGYFTIEKYSWAFVIVLSRTWSISLEGQTQRDIAFAPIAEFLNHDYTAGSGSVVGDYFMVNATRDYAVGDQVFDSYGPKSNFELLSVYGFLLPDNPIKAMSLHFSFKENNLVHSIVEPLLRNQDPKYQVIVIRENHIPVELLRAFRLSVMEFSELDHVNKVLAGKGITLKNELRAYRAAIKAVSSVLDLFPSTEEEDLALGQSGTLTFNQQNALYLRIGERRIAQNVVMVIARLWENILLEGQLPGEVLVD